ncbi:hypothetical protein [Streptomyces sp. NPDC094031]|uniref:hypothetical protein n=1 Tax=Streptomyces sp. NPDC094031 TaxID=3155307 RepID=UPI00332E1E4C
MSTDPGDLCVVHRLQTDSAGAEARALVDDRLRQLTRNGRTVPSVADASAPFQDPHNDQGEPYGLYKGDVLLACLTLDHAPDLKHWGQEAHHDSLLLRHLYTHPDHLADSVLVITLWAADYAARQGIPLLRAEVPAHHRRDANPLAGFLDRLKGMGWQSRGVGPGIADDRVVRLERQTEEIPGLAGIVRPALRARDDESAA